MIINRIGSYGGAVDLVALRAAVVALGPTLLLDADQISGNDGDAIGTWADDSGNGRNFTQTDASYKPLLKKGANGINGHNVLKFDGSNDFIKSAVNASTMISVSADTCFFVFRLIACTTNSADPFEDDLLICVEEYEGYHFRSDGTSFAYIYSGATKVATKSMSTATPYIAQTRHSSGTLYHSLNGGSEASVAAGNITSLADVFYLGGSVNSMIYTNIEIAEVILFNTALSESDRATVMAYLNAKYATY